MPIKTAFEATGEVDVVGRNRADAGIDDANVDLGVGDALDARTERFDRTLTVGLEDEVERFAGRRRSASA